MSKRKGIKQRYYEKIYTLRIGTPVLLSGNVQSEHFAAGENFQATILSNHLHFWPQ